MQQSLFPPVSGGHGAACSQCPNPVHGAQVYAYRDPPRIKSYRDFCATHLLAYVRKHYPNGRIVTRLSQQADGSEEGRDR
jgi:hypothetical protein